MSSNPRKILPIFILGSRPFVISLIPRLFELWAIIILVGSFTLYRRIPIFLEQNSVVLTCWLLLCLNTDSFWLPSKVIDSRLPSYLSWGKEMDTWLAQGRLYEKERSRQLEKVHLDRKYGTKISTRVRIRKDAFQTLSKILRNRKWKRSLEVKKRVI